MYAQIQLCQNSNDALCDGSTVLVSITTDCAEKLFDCQTVDPQESQCQL